MEEINRKLSVPPLIKVWHMHHLARCMCYYNIILVIELCAIYVPDVKL